MSNGRVVSYNVRESVMSQIVETQRLNKASKLGNMW